MRKKKENLFNFNVLREKFKTSKLPTTDNTDLKFEDIDLPLKQHISIQFVYAFFGAAFAVIIGIAVKSFSVIAFLAAADLIYVVLIYNTIHQCLIGKMYVYEGTCVNVHVKAKHAITDADFFIIRLSNHMMLKVSAKSKKDMQKIHMNDNVKVYSSSQNLNFMNGNMYTLPSYYYLCITGYCDAPVQKSETGSKKNMDNGMEVTELQDKQ